MNKILIVDDEKDIVELLKYNLESEKDFETIVAYNGKDAFDKAYNHKPHLILLDIMLPGVNGFDVCRELKSNVVTSDIPVIFITAKTNESDEINGFKLGADDYIKKPFSQQLVLTRVKSVLNRTYKEKEKIKLKDGIIQFRNLVVDLMEHLVKIDDEVVYFSKTELQLLYQLMSNEGKILTRKFLLNLIWGKVVYVQEQSIDFCISGIKRKLGDYAEFIETINGTGYRFNGNNIR
jgi:DNA-binding response OmpR family regulator